MDYQGLQLLQKSISVLVLSWLLLYSKCVSRLFNLCFEWTSSTLARDEFENYHNLYGPVADIATLYIASSYFYSDECGKYGPGLNRGVPMGCSTQTVGGSFRRRLNLNVTFSTRLTVQSAPMSKSNGKKSNMTASYFCMLSSNCPKRFYSSIQVQFYSGRRALSLQLKLTTRLPYPSKLQIVILLITLHDITAGKFNCQILLFLINSW